MTTLLYIDDLLANRVLLRDAMDRLSDLQVMAVGDGADGIHAAKVYQPTAILLDLNLKTEDGESVLARLKSDPDTRDIPVFILSADDDQGRFRRAVALGATGRIVKDPSLPVLVGSITSAVRSVH